MFSLRRCTRPLVAGVFALSLCAPLAAHAVAPEQQQPGGEPPAGRVTIDVATVNGSGCPAGTTAVAMSPDKTAATVTYSQFFAQAGPGSSSRDFRQTCQLGLRLHVPNGYTYAVAKADYRGFASIAEGAEGVQKATYYFQGSRDQRTARTKKMRGPVHEEYIFTDEVPIDDMVFAPCGRQRIFNVKTELNLNKRRSRGYSYMSIDSTDVSFATKLQFAWKRC